MAEVGREIGEFVVGEMERLEGIELGEGVGERGKGVVIGCQRLQLLELTQIRKTSCRGEEGIQTTPSERWG